MNRLEVGEVVVGSVKGIKPYGAFIDIGGVSGLLHISEISHEHIETPHNVLNVNDQMKVMIIDLDSERGRISLSTKALEPEPGDMLYLTPYLPSTTIFFPSTEAWYPITPVALLGPIGPTKDL